jgi:ABC-type branched-subunit amino acid transport system permease subunit
MNVVTKAASPGTAASTASISCPSSPGALLLGRRGRLLAPLLRPPVITTTGTDFGGVLFACAAFALVVDVGLNIVVGYAGLLDLGYVGFYAVGAYTVGVLTSSTGTGRSSSPCRWPSRSRW